MHAGEARRLVYESLNNMKSNPTNSQLHALLATALTLIATDTFDAKQQDAQEHLDLSRKVIGSSITGWEAHAGCEITAGITTQGSHH